jgi:hypothetical protein
MNGVKQKSLEAPTSGERGGRAIDAHAAFIDYLMRRLLAVNTSEMQRLSVALY